MYHRCININCKKLCGYLDMDPEILIIFILMPCTTGSIFHHHLLSNKHQTHTHNNSSSRICILFSIYYTYVYTHSRFFPFGYYLDTVLMISRIEDGAHIAHICTPVRESSVSAPLHDGVCFLISYNMILMLCCLQRIGPMRQHDDDEIKGGTNVFCQRVQLLPQAPVYSTTDCV